MWAEALRSSSGQCLKGALLLQPQVFEDGRGCLYETWNQQRWQQVLRAWGQRPTAFVQDNQSCSHRGVLRGLHWQAAPHAQAKLVRCVVGEIFDVAVDLRPASATFGQWGAVRLSGVNRLQLWIPEGFAHGFLCLTEVAEVVYKTTTFWEPQSERAIRWDDPALGIAWPLLQVGGQAPLLSAKDAQAMTLAEAEEALMDRV